MRNLADWVRQIWPFENDRAVVLRDYASIGREHRHFLTDVALRGFVFAPSDAKTDLDLAKAEGRRELALEIIKTCRVPPEQLFELIPTKPRGDNK